MENVDKDVAAMLSSLKKYDKLAESVAPVLMGKVLEKKDGKPEWLEKAEKKAEEKDSKEKVDEEEKNPWMDLAKKDDKKDGKTTKTKTGLKHEKDFDAKKDKKEDDEKDDLDEGVDPEVLEWMKRFANLGNMKGYGR